MEERGPTGWRVQTGSRLHFGLLGSSTELRQFGGCGLMIEDPGVDLIVSGASSNSVDGPVATGTLERVQRQLGAAAKRLHLPPERQFAVKFRSAIPEHAGLGSGTQTTLAIAQGICGLIGIASTPESLAILTDRGKRSAIGVHGFYSGGFLVDGGKGPITRLAPVVSRADFPAHWPILLVGSQTTSSWHGSREENAFAQCNNRQFDAVVDRMCRLLVSGIVPAVLEQDFSAFAAAIFEYNRRAGELFATQQCGLYSDAAIATTIDMLRSQGITAVGQSSWGPTVFAMVEDKDKADWLQRKIQSSVHFARDGVMVTRAKNVGACSGPIAAHTD